jgi:hypothetical protein
MEDDKVFDSEDSKLYLLVATVVSVRVPPLILALVLVLALALTLVHFRPIIEMKRKIQIRFLMLNID